MMTETFAFLGHHFDGVNVGDALTFAIISLVVYAALRTLRGLLLRYVKPSAAKARTAALSKMLVGLIKSTNSLFLLVVALYCGSYALPLRGRAESTVETIIQVAVLLQLGIWGLRVVLYSIEGFVGRQPLDDSARLATAMGAITFIARVVVWSLVGLLVLSALNINITALVTGLGIGGVAVALAAQNILGDLFASLSIVLDQPFAVGHFIVVGDMSGTVEHVGIKSTRIRSLSGEQIVQSNANLLSARIHNYKHLYERRVLFAIGVTYDTPPEKLEAIPAMIHDAIKANDRTRFDRAHFKDFGDSSLNFETVYYVLSSDYGTYMDIQQRINLELVKRFAAEKIEFAFPTRTLYVNQVGKVA
ncbi:MAG: mechanosensitive ion channel family protein [Alphaproteobacteria bacterium]|nr:mechanosensitive ion channel family protein [Alphaproteobacteria bacterium]MDE2498721.1 mechanosensitive ion channel family protein [Alphaproteobacteria bacterium]